MLVADAAAWKVIWPFLADSIAMAVVESAIEDVDNAMDDYVTQLQFWGQEKKKSSMYRGDLTISHIQLAETMCFPVNCHKFSVAPGWQPHPGWSGMSGGEDKAELTGATEKGTADWTFMGLLVV